MSIFVWRLWEIQRNNTALIMWSVLHGSGTLVKHPLKYTLCGMYGKPWNPGEVHQASCDKSNFQALKNEHIQSIMKLYTAIFPPHDRNDMPYEKCTCGIYGLKPDFPPLAVESHDILGVAEIWGKIIVAERGYRAQYAKMRAVVNQPTIARDYGVLNLPSIEYARQEFFA